MNHINVTFPYSRHQLMVALGYEAFMAVLGSTLSNLDNMTGTEMEIQQLRLIGTLIKLKVML